MPATPAWPPRSAPRLFVPPTIVGGRNVVVEGNQAHYLAKVMRVGLGSTIILCDDVTGEWACQVLEVAKRHVLLEPVEHLRGRQEVPDFWLCPALLKKDRFDLVLEKGTELGVARIRPVITKRCVADKLNSDRVRSVVVEAAEQCARTALTQLDEPVKLDRFLSDWPSDRTLFFADENGGEPAKEAFEGCTIAALLTGPEGGFDDAERAAICGLPQARPITLGPRILRGETAAIAATALWMGVAGDWHNSLARG